MDCVSKNYSFKRYEEEGHDVAFLEPLVTINGVGHKQQLLKKKAGSFSSCLLSLTILWEKGTNRFRRH